MCVIWVGFKEEIREKKKNKNTVTAIQFQLPPQTLRLHFFTFLSKTCTFQEGSKSEASTVSAIISRNM